MDPSRFPGPLSRCHPERSEGSSPGSPVLSLVVILSGAKDPPRFPGPRKYQDREDPSLRQDDREGEDREDPSLRQYDREDETALVVILSGGKWYNKLGQS